MDDVYVWGGMYGLTTTPENRTIDEVTHKLRVHAASKTDYQTAYEAQVAKRQYLDTSFTKHQRLQQLANEQSRLAQAIRDPEMRKAGLRIAQNTQQFVAATDRWRKLQSKKGEWNEELFAALRDDQSLPELSRAKELNEDVTKAVSELEQLRDADGPIFSEFEGVVLRETKRH